VVTGGDGSGHLGGRPTVGIVGAGQLARMTIEAASALGVKVVLLAEDPKAAATEVSGHVLLGAPTDAGQLWALAARCDVMTFDHEQVDLEMLRTFEGAGVAVRPGVSAMQAGVDKAHMRRTLGAAGLPVVPWSAIDPDGPRAMAAQVEDFASAHGWPVVIKASRGGYDGKGVWVVPDPESARRLCATVGAAGVPLLAERYVTMDFELSALVVRSASETRTWPAVETCQVDGICREVLVPGRVSPPVAANAQALAARIAEAIGLIGVMAVELFATGEELTVNELALRPHNSGHWTMEGSVTSQFENHLRAVLGLPLGATDAVFPHTAMVNVLGSPDGSDPSRRLADALAVGGAHVHLYGKDPRPGRKLGHVTVCGQDPAEVRSRAWAAARALGTPEPSPVRPPAPAW